MLRCGVCCNMPTMLSFACFTSSPILADVPTRAVLAAMTVLLLRTKIACGVFGATIAAVQPRLLLLLLQPLLLSVLLPRAARVS